MKGCAVSTFSHVQNIRGTELCLSRPGNSCVQNYFPGALWRGQSVPENVRIRFLSSQRKAPPLLCTCAVCSAALTARPSGVLEHIVFICMLTNTSFIAQPSQHMHETPWPQTGLWTSLGCDIRFYYSFLGHILQPQATCGLSPNPALSIYEHRAP